MPGNTEQHANPLIDLVETVKNDRKSGKYSIKIDPKKYGFDIEEELWKHIRQLAGVTNSKKQGWSNRIAASPHYLVKSTELAAWIAEQGDDTSWQVDGDPLLMSRLSLPCPPEEIIAELKKINRILLVADPEGVGNGNEVTAAELSHLVETEESEGPCLFLSWKNGSSDWLLIKDTLADA